MLYSRTDEGCSHIVLTQEFIFLVYLPFIGNENQSKKFSLKKFLPAECLKVTHERNCMEE